MRISMKYGVLLAVFMASACMIAGAAVAGPAVNAPTLTGFAPSHGAVGQKITIYGHDLGGATVTFGTVAATAVTVNATGTHVAVNVPPDASAGAYPIVVTTSGGSTTATGSFMVTAPTGNRQIARPHIFSFAPLRGKVGTKVTISGANFGGAMWVKFNGIKAAYTVPTAAKIIARVPKNAHTGMITIRTSTGMATKSLHFVVVG
jgi:hypothetical protein